MTSAPRDYDGGMDCIGSNEFVVPAIVLEIC